MARREIPEINAGSMADIAFLLLIFWLVTTTIDSDEGVKRQLPPPVPPDMEQQEVKDGDVYNVRTNFRDELLVEKEVMSIGQLKDGAKDFLIATGTGLLHPERPNVTLGDDNMKYPERQWVRKSELILLEQSYLAAGQPKAAERVREKLTAIELFGGDYKELPGSALISLQRTAAPRTTSICRFKTNWRRPSMSCGMSCLWRNSMNHTLSWKSATAERRRPACSTRSSPSVWFSLNESLRQSLETPVKVTTDEQVQEKQKA